MREGVLVLNAGSSSIKFLLFSAQGETLEPIIRGQVEGLHTAPRFVARDAAGVVVAERAWGEGVKLGHEGAVAHLADFLREQGRTRGIELRAVGHRIVHGGLQYTQPVRLDASVLAALEKFVPLAPLHQPNNLAPIRALLEHRPELPQVGCFDTAFHSTNPDVARRFALPSELHDAGVRRYGFHGLSYEYVAAALVVHDARAAAGKTIVCHLGNGSSLCALDGARSVASTMGFTAVDGLPMGTRCGNIDPGVLLYLMDERRMDARAIEKLIYQQSGLLGISGISSDMRKLLDSNDPKAKLAVDVYLYRIQREVGSLAAALGGLDALVFTAGIGENSAAIRQRICRDAAWLGVELDRAANERGGPRISSAGSRVAALVIPTNEELMIARHTRSLVASSNVAAA
ncbi:MAG TPA: acetate/propionate family kinase [Burkholderiales bacterium]|nr:acetate/propionate family kinase [Burkholderiales bacterium]